MVTLSCSQYSYDAYTCLLIHAQAPAPLPQELLTSYFSHQIKCIFFCKIFFQWVFLKYNSKLTYNSSHNSSKDCTEIKYIGTTAFSYTRYNIQDEIRLNGYFCTCNKDTSTISCHSMKLQLHECKPVHCLFENLMPTIQLSKISACFYSYNEISLFLCKRFSYVCACRGICIHGQ